MQTASIVLAMYPYSDSNDYKIRPALILSNEKFNRAHNYFLLCPLTTKMTLPAYEIPLQKTDVTGTLNEQSYIRTDALASINKDRVLKEIGKVTPKLYKQVIVKINENFAKV